MFLKMYNLKNWQDSRLHHIWFSGEISNEYMLMTGSTFSAYIQFKDEVLTINAQK